MKIKIFDDKKTLGQAAATQAADIIRNALKTRGKSRILVATGGSQFEFLEALTKEEGIDWAKVEMFHFDEYIGLSIKHPASFRKYLLERLINKVGIREHHLLDGESDPEKVCKEVGALLASAPIDVAFPGIGENGHLAFNDPPADFQTERPYIVVNLDEACRKQQIGEGWFKSMAEVPERAISISIKQLMKAKTLISVVPDARKADAVQRCMEGPVGPNAPASIMRTHPDVTLYLDKQSSALLNNKTISSGAPA